MGYMVKGDLTPIIPVIIGDPQDAVMFAEKLQENGIYAPAIRPPTVPNGESRIRLTVTSDHGSKEIDYLLECFHSHWKRVEHDLMKGFFVTGTDTDVGKTIISSGLAAVLKEKKIDVGVFKPLLSGIAREDPASDTSLLKQLSQTSLSYEEITPFQFKEPLAPYVAGKLEGKIVRMEEVLSHWEKIREKHEFFIVEGAGGISVPLGEGFLVSDLIKASTAANCDCSSAQSWDV